MDTDLRIIFVEDVPADAALIERALSRGGLSVALSRVDTREGFLHELESRPPDVILSDHGLPSFDGFTALAIAHEKLPDVPFIFVTNALSWEMDIEKLAPGVMDFVLKRQPESLAPAIRRALYHAGRSKTQRAKEEKLEQMCAKLQALLAEYEPNAGLIPICAGCKKIRDREKVWHIPEIFLERRLGLDFTHGICPDCAKKYYGEDSTL